MSNGSSAKQEIPIKHQCILISHSIILQIIMGQNLWKLKHQVTKRCMCHVGGIIRWQQVATVCDLNRKTMSMEQLPTEITVRRQPEDQMTRNKSHSYWQFHEHRPCHTRWMASQLQVLRSKQTIQRPPNATV